MKDAAPPRQLEFRAKLERIAETLEYYALTVPGKVSRALKARGPVPVSAKLNGRVTFLVSLAPIGGGRHWLRVNAKARAAAGIKQGDTVRVRITVLDRSARIFVPGDLAKALGAEGLTEDFASLPIGKRNHLVGWIEEAARPETRERRIQASVEEAHKRRERRFDRSSRPRA